jgi:hypothetical protein
VSRVKNYCYEEKNFKVPIMKTVEQILDERRGAIAKSWWRKGSSGSDLSLRSDNLDSVSELYTEMIRGNWLWPLRRRQRSLAASASLKS